ncbi:hypothetical protein BGZ96_000637 [Linnemannia gamsii]|uniref:Uncharacterized protein n=1 Tax=Linnemannia gamsii TaxID=64522 RepID=A0ABQ7JNV2_9FUNG|nr:hypothetical protein BGZ96_000637 [Linnemannia gamsii]
MIVPLPFWVSSITITIIKIIISGTIGAALTFYARYSSDSYANSIRWSRIGGLYETINLLKNSRRKVPNRSSIVMASMIAANLFALFVSILLGVFVSRTDKANSATVATVVTTQFPPVEPLAWTAWSGFMQADASMEDTLVLVLNDTRVNPEPKPRTVYKPLKYDYEVACDETGVVIGSTNKEFAASYPSPHDNCKVLFVQLPRGVESYDWDLKRATSRLISADVHMMVAPISHPKDRRMELEPYLHAFNGKVCTPPARVGLSLFRSFPKDGMTSLPSTDATRCQYGTGDSFIMISTSIKFAINRLNDFDKVTNSIFDDPSNLPLLQSMRTAINDGIFQNPTNTATLVILTKMSSNVDVLMCISTFFNQATNTDILCTYLVVATITTKPQKWDPTITAEFKQNFSTPFDAVNLTNQNEIRVHHMPLKIIEAIDTYSTSHLLKATTDAAVFLASLGHNVALNSQAERLCILFDTVRFNDAFEVPTTLVIVVSVTVVMCVLVWLISEICYKPVFNGSLYKVLYEDIKSKREVKSKEEVDPNEAIKPDEDTNPTEETKSIEEIKTPMLMDCTHDPLAFEGYQLTPDLEEQKPLVFFYNRLTGQAPTPQVSTLQSPNQQSPVL